MLGMEKEIKEFAQFLDSISPIEFSALGAVIGLLISIPLTIDQQNSVGNFFESIGQTILTVNAKASGELPSVTELNEKINYLYKEIERLKKISP